MRKKVSMFNRTAKKFGFYGAMKQIATNILFDLNTKVDTTGIVALDKLKIQADTANCVEYCPTSTTQLAEVFKVLSSHFDKDKQGFLDYGCGKGRVLISAKQSGYKNIFGVEFSPKLCQVAEQNMAKLGFGGIHISNMCATGYNIPQEVSVIYMYNPFGGEVLQSVLKNIRLHKEQYKKPLLIVYVNPVCKDYFSDFKSVYISKNDFMIFEA